MAISGWPLLAALGVKGLNIVNADIALFTETWLSDSVPNTSINIKGYQLLRHDCVGWQHGGVCMFVKNLIQCKVLSDFHHEDHEVLWANLRPI